LLVYYNTTPVCAYQLKQQTSVFMYKYAY